MTFKEYLTESKNKHLIHIEDTIILSGSAGGREAINFIKSLRDMLSGHTEKAVSVTVKWDGAPSIVAGINPENGRFFVGTKGAFAKNPKLMYTESDIQRTYGSSGVAPKLAAALKYLPELGYHGVYQGDFLYTPDDLEQVVIEGEKYITFQPNTIVYAVPANSILARQILSSKMGFIVHTAYKGDTIESLSASFGLSKSKFKNSRNVWLQDSEYHDVSGKATFSEEETATINALLSMIGKTFAGIDSELLDRLKSDETLQILLMTYNNSKVRKGQKITDVRAHAQAFIHFTKEKYQKEIDGLKKDDAKKKRQDIVDDITYFISGELNSLSNMFLLQNLVVDAKEMILSKLNSVQSVNTFIQTPNGYRVTNPEGFVVTDRMGNTRKLVDRLEFSFQNFTAIKKWV